MALRLVVPEKEVLFVAGRVLVTFVGARRGKCVLLIEGPGKVHRGRALRKTLAPGEFEQRISQLRNVTMRKSKPAGCP